MKKYIGLFLLIFAVMFVSVPAQAAITFNFNTGTTYSTTALTGYATTGAMMDGMKVTAYFADGTSEMVLWQKDTATGPAAGMAEGTNFALYENGDTFGSIWSLTSDLALSKLLIQAAYGDTVFDTTHIGDVEGTPGSARGWTFEYQGSASDINLNVTYSDAVALTGFAAVGDLYLNLAVEFLNPKLWGAAAPFQFIQDTDNLKYSGDITPVSEPSMIALFFSGLAGLAGFGWRFRK